MFRGSVGEKYRIDGLDASSREHHFCPEYYGPGSHSQFGSGEHSISAVILRSCSIFGSSDEASI